LSKVYTSAVVIIPPEEKWVLIQEIRKKYDRQINRWMPHINLLYPFVPEDQFNKYKRKITAVCNEIQPFEIIFREFKYFPHKHQNFTMWLLPEPSNLIIKLQSQLLEIFPDCNDVNKHKGGFTPHLSVGQKKGRSLLNSTLKELHSQWNDLKFNLKSIFFISRESGGISKYQVIKEIPLSISEN